MPSNIVQSFAIKTGYEEKEVERLWKKAKQLVKKQYPKVKEKSEQYWKLVTGILKKMLGIKKEDPDGDILKVCKFFEMSHAISLADVPADPTSKMGVVKKLDMALIKKKKKKYQKENNLLGELECKLEELR